MEIQLTAAINFISSKDNDKEHVKHPKSYNIEVMINNKTDEAIKEHFLNFISRYQIWLQTSVKGSDFV